MEMRFFKKLSDIFNPSSPQKAADFTTYLSVKCNRCGEIIQARVNLRNDLSLEDGSNPSNPTYFCRKIIIGEKRCFQAIEVELSFDGKRNIIRRQISGGTFTDDD
jgi:hypothetical protein